MVEGLQESFSRIVGWVTRSISTKTVTFVWCWVPPSLVQCVVPREVAKSPLVGSVIEAIGVWQPYGGKRPGFTSQELVAEQFRVLVAPAEAKAAQQRWSDLNRPVALMARNSALTAAEQYLNRNNFTRVETPIIIGDQATLGATKPFIAQTGNEAAYLTVNNILRQHEYQQSGLRRIYEVSRLFWAQDYADRFSLNEIYLLEYSIGLADRSVLMALTEDLLEVMRQSVSQVAGPRGMHNLWLDKPLRDLPVLTFSEAIHMAVSAGIEPSHSGHVLPSAIDGIIARQLGAAGFWIIDLPAETSPFYTRRAVGDGFEVGYSMELRLASVPNAGAGSEWVTDPHMAESTIASWSQTPAGVRYIDVLRRGLPPCSGFTLGLDRVIMHLLDASNVRHVVPHVRDRRTFRGAPLAIQREQVVIDPEDFAAIPRAKAVEQGSKQIARVSEWLVGHGFVSCITSLLADPWMHVLIGAPPIEVVYFGRTVHVIPDRAPHHHQLLSEGTDRIFEIGPVATGRPWWQPAWKLDVSWIAPDLIELQQTAIVLLRLLAQVDGISKGLAQAVRNLTPDSLLPMASGRPGYVRNSFSGPDVSGFSWSWRGRQIISGGLWLFREAHLKAALGDAAEDHQLLELKAFLQGTPPPAGGLSIDLSSFPGIEWGPPFTVKARAN